MSTVSDDELDGARLVRVFAASPGDVQAERDSLPEVVERINDTLGEERGLRLVLWRWERQATPGLGEPQDLMNPELDRADVVVAIFWNRFGTAGAKGMTGSQEEVLRAAQRWAKSGKPRVMMYFCRRPAVLDEEALEQRLALLKFRKQLPPVLVREYVEVRDFETAVEQDLRKVAAELVPVTPSKRARPAEPASRRPEDPLAGCDVDAYLDHVHETCGFVLLTGLLAEQAAPAVAIDDVYVPLLATRPDLARGPVGASEDGESIADARDAVGALCERLRSEEGEGAGDLDAAIAEALASVGVPEGGECRRPATLASVRSRLQALGEVDESAVRAVLTTVELEDAVRLAPNLVVEGDPGAGKTTTLMRIAVRLREARLHPGSDAAARLGLGDDPPLPVFVALRRFRGWLSEHLGSGVSPTAEHLEEFLVETEGAFGGNRQWLPAALQAGAAFVLLDGLDEVPDEHYRDDVAAAVRAFTRRHADCRYVLSSRPTGLTGRVPVLLRDFARCEVQELDTPRRERFVRAWYGALVQDPAEAERRASDLLARIEASGIQELVSTPIMLTAVAVVHQTGGELPERRAELYEHCVAALCHRWDAARDEFGKVLCGPVPLQGKLGFLEEVARAIHLQGEAEPSLERGELRELARDHLPVEGAERPDAEVLDQLVHGLIERSGMLVPEGGGRSYRFRHQTFQEFLVGRWLCDRAGDLREALRPHLADGYWREVVVLAAGHEAASSSRHAVAFLKDLIELARELGEDEPRVAAFATLCRSLLDVRSYPVRGVDALAESVAAELAGLVDDVSQPGSLADRVLLAETLGRFGDPRLAAEARWVGVPAGEFVYGGKERRTVEAFEIRRWPVTVAEYAPFVASGYAEERWWGADGWKWRKDERCESPEDWAGQLAGPDNRPVTGVSWWEARAFCAWSTRRAKDAGDGRVVRLPTELEWEKAAVGGLVLADGRDNPLRGREYPWGDRWDSKRANTGESELWGLKPVGCYPAGRGPYGTWDQAGNVWEWCADSYGSRLRVLRGGAFDDPARVARSACRLGYDPECRYDVVGFRPARVTTG